MEYNAKLYTQNESKINGHNIFHYLIDTCIGQFHIVEFEAEGKEFKRYIIDNDNTIAERKYKSCCNYVLKHFG